MDQSTLYQRRARECATLRDQAKSELARARLDRECADWLALAARAPHAELRIERSWLPVHRTFLVLDGR